MALIARNKGGGDFTPAPVGLHNAVCVDVVDLGDVQTVWEGKTSWKHKCRVVWQIDEKMEDGKPFIVMQRYTVSLHENSALRPALESWRGRPFTDDELEGFDIEKLVGAPCALNVVHRKSDGKTYANVASVAPRAKGWPKLEPDYEAYTRVKDRDDYVPPTRHQEAEPEGHHDDYGNYDQGDDGAPDYDDSDIPF